MTTHIMQNLENILDDIIILDSVQPILQSSLKSFINNFHQYKIKGLKDNIEKNKIVINFENIGVYSYIYSYKSLEEVKAYLEDKKIECESIIEKKMNLEEAFMGYTGRY